MAVFQYIVSLPSVAESNDTLIAKKVIRVLDCSSNLVEVNSCSMWNFNHCPTDNNYCNPFVIGDKIYFQLIVPRNVFSFVFVSVMDASTHEEIVQYAPYVAKEEGYDFNQNFYKNYIIDTTQFDDVSCFYLKIVAYRCTLTAEEQSDFESCVADLMEQDYPEDEAQQICLANYCDDSSTTTIYTEPYCKVKCQNTVLVEGVFPNNDCFGNYYGDFYDITGTDPVVIPGSNSYKAQIRMFAEVTPTQFTIEQTKVNGRRKSAKLLTGYTFRSKKIPFYVAERLANMFSAMEFLVDDVEYDDALEIQKNTDQGMMWIVQSTLLRECNTNNFSCNS
jgi:hypothetical protein